jgi:hypothetical protein
MVLSCHIFVPFPSQDLDVQGHMLCSIFILYSVSESKEEIGHFIVIGGIADHHLMGS